MKATVDKSYIDIELSDGTKVQIEEKRYGSITDERGTRQKNFLFITVKGMEILKMFLNEVDV